MITGFGRLGTPFAAQHFDVLPDMITMAKGLTNGAVPMGAVAARKEIYDTFMHGPENAIELFHGYTYSAHPVACAAGIATQQIYQREGLLTRAAEMADYWADAVHSLKGLPHVIDLRNLGLIGAIELEPIPGKPGARALRRVRARLREGHPDPRDRRHHRAVAAADHREAARRRALREAGGGAAGDGLRKADVISDQRIADSRKRNARPPCGDRAFFIARTRQPGCATTRSLAVLRSTGTRSRP